MTAPVHSAAWVDSELDAFNAIKSVEDKKIAFAGLSVDAKLTVLYRELTGFRAEVAEIEKKAAAMADPENMMKLAEKFLGNGFM